MEANLIRDAETRVLESNYITISKKWPGRLVGASQQRTGKWELRRRRSLEKELKSLDFVATYRVNFSCAAAMKWGNFPLETAFMSLL